MSVATGMSLEACLPTRESARDLVDLDLEVRLPMTGLSLVSLTTLELDHVDLGSLDFTHDLGLDRSAVDVGRAKLGRPIIALDGQYAIEHDGVLLFSSEIDFQHVAFTDDDLSSTVFYDGIHGKSSWDRESHIIPVLAPRSSLGSAEKMQR